jgi:predicted amidohydrolase YtcJ
MLYGGLACSAVLSVRAAAAALDPAAPPDISAADGDRATTVFRGGAIYTLDPGRPWAQAVAVRGNAITAVGSDEAVERWIGPDTRVIELGGRMMMPGFVEGHIHPFLGAFMSAGLDLQLPTREDALAAIARYAAEHPTGPLRGFGWRVDMFPPEGPSKADLDRVVPDRPAFFFAIDGHSLWVNSKALELAGIDRDTPDPIPDFSYYVRDAKGEPTGYILEVAAVLATVNEIDPISVDAMARLLDLWLPKAAAAGITSIFDAGVPPIGGDPGALLAIYTDLEKQGRLPFRVVACHMVKGLPVDDAVSQAVALRSRLNTELVRAGVLKIVGDGTAGGYTALLLEPYADKPDTLGQSPFSPEAWTRMILDAEAAGIDVHAHACGEGTTRLALDAMAAAVRANPDHDRRHTIAHLVLVEDSDIPRFAELGVNAQFSANWMSADPDSIDILIERYGPERQKRIYRPRSILETGGRVSFGTDWPAAGYFSTYKPLDAIQVAMTRQLIGKPDAPVLEPARERLDLAQAIHANTMGAAYHLRMERLVGSIELGKRADLIVLERNLFDVDPHEIAGVAVEMTMMDGRFQHGGAS